MLTGTFRKFLIVLFIFLVNAIPLSASPITYYCSRWGQVQSGLLFNNVNPSESKNFHNGYDFGTPLTSQQLQSIENIDAKDSTWRGYGDINPLGQPLDVFSAYTIVLETTTGEKRFEISLSPTDTEWVYIEAFQGNDIGTDNQGNHMGIHPCRAFRVTTQIISFIFMEPQNE